MRRSACLVALLALVACRGDAPRPVAPETSSPPVVTTPTADAAAPADAAAAPADTAAAPADTAAPKSDAAEPPAATVVVRLVSPGAEPRRPLRYAIAAGSEQSASLAMTTELELGSSGQKMPTALPKARMLIRAKVASVSPAGEAKVGLAIVESDLAEGATAGPTRAGEKLAEVIRGLKGLSGDKVADARGVSQRFALAFPPGDDRVTATAALRPVVQGFERAIDQMTVPFPDEAVGVGAKWDVAQKVVEAGMTLDQTTTFEVVAMNGALVSLRFSETLAAPPGKIQSTLAGGLTGEVLRVAGSGDGTVDVDLGKVLPVKLTARNSIAMGLELDAQGQKRTLDVEMRVALDAAETKAP